MRYSPWARFHLAQLCHGPRPHWMLRVNSRRTHALWVRREMGTTPRATRHLVRTAA
jgi:hypothetical protein